jgi:hypothetical protein
VRPFEISQTVTAQASVDFSGLSALLLSPKRLRRAMMDCPESTFVFRPFLLPSLPGETDNYVLFPLRADTAPMSHMISALIDGAGEGD